MSSLKIRYSLRDIIKLSTVELKNKIFTFDFNMAQSGDTKKLNKEDLNTMKEIIKKLKCMRNNDEEYLPTFKFFQFKKSYIRDKSGEEEDQIMLSIQDVSQKILADTNKAESELLSLINSTISHEMRNPLNSIINQCKIAYAMCV